MDEDKVIQKLIELDQKIDGLASKTDLRNLEEKIISAIEKLKIHLQIA